jgi:predicted metal-dependent phosphotriesterase family hydrolase
MDPEGRCSAMALVLSDAEMNSQPQEELLVHMDELRECIELMEKAQKIQEKTVARLKQDLSFMEDVSQEISNNIIAFQGTHESLFFYE